MNPTDDMEIMKEEIFGPLLPIKEFSEVDETISYVNSNDKPLGLYYFGSSKNEEEQVLSRTSSGGVTINDVLGHIQQEDLPFEVSDPQGLEVIMVKRGLRLSAMLKQFTNKLVRDLISFYLQFVLLIKMILRRY